MKKKTKWIVAGLSGTVLLFAAVSGFVGWQVVSGSTQLVTNEGTSDVPYDLLESQGIEFDRFRQVYQVEELALASSFEEHIIPADYLYSPSSNHRKDHPTVILVHGLRDNRYANYPIAEFLLEQGFNVLLYDQRSTNENTAPNTTFGYLEKYDLIDWVDYVEKEAPGQRIGVWSQSFGGATVGLAMAHEGMNEKVDFLILDSPVSDMEWMIREGVEELDTGLPPAYMIWAGSIMNKFRLGFSYGEADVAEAMRNVEIPVLIINNTGDPVTPYFMGRDIYEAIPGDQKELWTVADNSHARTWVNHNQEYREKLERFLSLNQ